MKKKKMGVKAFCASEKHTRLLCVFNYRLWPGEPRRTVKMCLWMQMQHFLGDAPGNRLFPPVILKNKREANLLI